MLLDGKRSKGNDRSKSMDTEGSAVADFKKYQTFCTGYFRYYV